MVPVVDRPAGQSADMAAALAELKPGDTVRVTLQNGDRMLFVVAEAQADALVASVVGRRFPHADIVRLEVRRVATVKTIALIAAVPFMALFFVGFLYGLGQH
jgi:hypothetical protein